MWRILVALVVAAVLYGAYMVSEVVVDTLRPTTPTTLVSPTRVVSLPASTAVTQAIPTPWYKTPTPRPRSGTATPTFTRFYPTATPTVVPPSPTVVCPTPEDGHLYTVAPDGCWR